jgi:hypothetical protein
MDNLLTILRNEYVIAVAWVVWLFMLLGFTTKFSQGSDLCEFCDQPMKQYDSNPRHDYCDCKKSIKAEQV